MALWRLTWDLCNTLMKRRFTLVAIAAALILAIWQFASSPKLYAQPRIYNPDGVAQLFGQSAEGNFFGTEAYLTTPDPTISSGWTVALTAVGDWWSPRFVEAGAMKSASGSRHPYSAWKDEYGYYDSSWRTDINLTPNGYYRYRVTYAGTGVWDAYIKTGAGWYFIATPQLYRYSGYLYSGSGGESSSSSTAIGPLTTKGNRHRSGSSWSAWCYSWTVNNCGGTISECNISDHSWSVSYAP